MQTLLDFPKALPNEVFTHLAAGLNVHEGQVTYEAVARDLGYDYVPVASLVA